MVRVSPPGTASWSAGGSGWPRLIHRSPDSEPVLPPGVLVVPPGSPSRPSGASVRVERIRTTAGSRKRCSRTVRRSNANCSTEGDQVSRRTSRTARPRGPPPRAHTAIRSRPYGGPSEGSRAQGPLGRRPTSGPLPPWGGTKGSAQGPSPGVVMQSAALRRRFSTTSQGSVAGSPSSARAARTRVEGGPGPASRGGSNQGTVTVIAAGPPLTSPRHLWAGAPFHVEPCADAGGATPACPVGPASGAVPIAAQKLCGTHSRTQDGTRLLVRTGMGTASRTRCLRETITVPRRALRPGASGLGRTGLK